MTSNIGADKILRNRRVGFGNSNELEEENKILLNEIKKEFKAEFINRIDNIIVFKKLNKKDLIKIIDILLKKVEQRILNKGFKMKVSQDVKEFIVENEIDMNYGARQLERKIKEIIEDKIANEILNGNLRDGTTIEFYLEKNKIKSKTN